MVLCEPEFRDYLLCSYSTPIDKERFGKILSDVSFEFHKDENGMLSGASIFVIRFAL